MEDVFTKILEFLKNEKGRQTLGSAMSQVIRDRRWVMAETRRRTPVQQIPDEELNPGWTCSSGPWRQATSLETHAKNVFDDLKRADKCLALAKKFNPTSSDEQRADDATLYMSWPEASIEKALNEPVECKCGVHRQDCDYHRL
jgi:hypothetical protein